MQILHARVHVMRTSPTLATSSSVGLATGTLPNPWRIYPKLEPAAMTTDFVLLYTEVP